MFLGLKNNQKKNVNLLDDLGNTDGGWSWHVLAIHSDDEVTTS